jgi:uncharacterized protein DUF2442
MNPRVKRVSPRDGYTLAIEFSNGEVGVYDCTPLLDQGVFKELKDATYFGRAFVHGGTVAWPTISSWPVNYSRSTYTLASRVAAMRTVCSFFLLILLLSGCSYSPLGEAGEPEITFVNQTDRPFAVLVFEREDSHLIDPAPAFSEAEFEERKIEVGSSGGPREIGEYERGDDVVVWIYADCGCEINAQIVAIAGPNAKPMVKRFTLTGDELEQKDYRVTIAEL